MIKCTTTLLLSLFLFGCSTGGVTPATNKYSLDVTPLKYHQAQDQTLPVLRVLQATIAPQFSSKGFVYKTSTTEYITDPYNQFITAPNDQITQSVTGHLYDNVNAQVIGSDNLLLSNYILQLKITGLYADYQDKKNPTANLSTTVILYQLVDGKTTIVNQDEFSFSHPTAVNDPSSLITAYNECLKQLDMQLIAMINSGINQQQTIDQA